MFHGGESNHHGRIQLNDDGQTSGSGVKALIEYVFEEHIPDSIRRKVRALFRDPSSNEHSTNTQVLVFRSRSEQCRQYAGYNMSPDACSRDSRYNAATCVSQRNQSARSRNRVAAE